jgi:hypothetical protein
MAPHSNPNLSYFVVIEGGGFVQVGDERARVAAGEAVVWPANVVHGAWTELTPMRAIVVEFAQDAAGALLLEGAVELPAGPAAEPPTEPPTRTDPADGALAAQPAVRPADRGSPEREPW